jgi:DNA-binding LacI/PurR family transcriptional regulator
MTSRARRAWRPPRCPGRTRDRGGSTPRRRRGFSRPRGASGTGPAASTVNTPGTGPRARRSTSSSRTSPTPFYGDIIKGAHEAAQEAGYQLTLSHTNESPEVERQAIERELEQVDGIVIASSRMTDSALRMMAKQKPMVLLNRIIPEVSCVVNDSPRGIRRAAEHLSALGHARIHYVAGPENSWADGVRWRALREAAAQLYLDVRRIGPNEPTVLAGLTRIRR